MKDFGLQLFSCRDQFTCEADCKAAFLALKEMGYSYVQTAGTYDAIAPEKFAEYVKDAGLTVCGTHYNWDRIMNDVEGTVAYHKLLGTTNIGIGGMPTEARLGKFGDGELEKFIEDFNRMARIYAERGFKLTYHNHSFEFEKYGNDGRTKFDYLVDGLDADTTSFVLDTYWVQHGGADVRATIERLKGRVEILHLKDMEANRTYVLSDGREISAPAIIHVGGGNINFKDIIPLAEECGVKYFVVEDDRCIPGQSMLDMKRSADHIKANFIK